MLNVDEALALALSAARSRPEPLAERVSVLWGAGRVLAEHVSSPTMVPGHDYSAMDGYAVRLGDLEGQDALQVVGECRTGHESAPLPAGVATRIFTGAAIPEGADTVLMQENVERHGERMHWTHLPKLGANIRRAGEDLKKGDTVLQPGEVLGPFQLALLCTVERTEILVRSRPEVSIVCTGDELRAPGSTFFGGHLAESNSVALSALVEGAGGVARRRALVRDEMAELKDALLAASEVSDLILSVGGVSVGDHDLVRPALEQLGAEIVFHKVRIKPGKPALLARLGRSLVLGLPGNPSSSQVVFSIIGVPLLRALGGRLQVDTLPRSARLKAAFTQRSGRRGYYRGRLDAHGVEVLDNQSSGASTSSAWSNCFVVVPEDVETLLAGDQVSVIVYSDLR